MASKPSNPGSVSASAKGSKTVAETVKSDQKVIVVLEQANLEIVKTKKVLDGHAFRLLLPFFTITMYAGL